MKYPRIVVGFLQLTSMGPHRAQNIKLSTQMFSLFMQIEGGDKICFSLVIDRCFWNIPLIRMTKLTIYDTI